MYVLLGIGFEFFDVFLLFEVIFLYIICCECSLIVIYVELMYMYMRDCIYKGQLWYCDF